MGWPIEEFEKLSSFLKQASELDHQIFEQELKQVTQKKNKQQKTNRYGYFIKNHYWYLSPITCNHRTPQKHKILPTQDPIVKKIKNIHSIKKLEMKNNVTFILIGLKGSWIENIQKNKKHIEWRDHITNSYHGNRHQLQLCLASIPGLIFQPKPKENKSPSNAKKLQGIKHVKYLVEFRKTHQLYIKERQIEGYDVNKKEYNHKKDPTHKKVVAYLQSKWNINEDWLLACTSIKPERSPYEHKNYKTAFHVSWEEVVKDVSFAAIQAES